jgi:trigger factor
MAENVRPVAQPEVNITKFVPFTTLEVEAKVAAVGKIKLPDYKNIKLAKKPVEVTAKDVNEVIAQLRERAAEKTEVKRAAKNGDEVMIDFVGTDAKTKESVSGADGKDYPLMLGSNSFIPGFEANLIGLKPGEEKTFTLEFPSNYGVKALQNRKVTFKVTVKKVNELKQPELDDAFAAKMGPVKTVAELKADIKKQLTAEKQQRADRDYENELIKKLAEKTEAVIPKALVDEELDRLENQEKQNLAYRGQTWQEHLKDEGLSEEQHREQKRPDAETRVKAGLMLSEIAEAEGLQVTPEELEIRMQLIKGQYQDPAMQAELSKPEARREIASGLLTEKTINKLRSYAS